MSILRNTRRKDDTKDGSDVSDDDDDGKGNNIEEIRNREMPLF